MRSGHIAERLSLPDRLLAAEEEKRESWLPLEVNVIHTDANGTRSRGMYTGSGRGFSTASTVLGSIADFGPVH